MIKRISDSLQLNEWTKIRLRLYLWHKTYFFVKRLLEKRNLNAVKLNYLWN